MSQRVFLQQVMTGEDKVAVIGCGCSMATESVAQISRFWNITQVCADHFNLHLGYECAPSEIDYDQKLPK